MTQEPEEYLESKFVSTLAATCLIPVVGMLTPATAGTVKGLTSDTFVGVRVDLQSQDGDYKYRAPFAWTVEAKIFYALADDASGTAFRDECRRVRNALEAFIGDGCATFDGDEFECSAFELGASQTSSEGGDNPVKSKAYTATIKGRIINQQEAVNG